MAKSTYSSDLPSRGEARLKLNLRRKRYSQWLRRADDADCLTLIWAVRALQSGNENAARRYLTFPREAVMDGILGDHAIYPWELETFVTSLLTTVKDKPRLGRHHISNCKTFASIRLLTNLLRSIEDSEYLLKSSPEDIFEEMYRIGHRQFSWQLGPNSEQLFRFAYVYGQGACGEFFEQANGLSVSDFLCLSLALLGVFFDKPWTELPDPANLGLPKAKMVRALELQGIHLAEARKRASQLNSDATQRLGRTPRTAYMPSLLRQKPIVRVERKLPAYIAPLPPLIMSRATAGLYYDIKQGPDQLLTEANARFEDYIRDLLTAYLPEIEAIKEAAYGPKGRQVDPPDCLVKDSGQVVLAIECKATKLTFEAQYAENPVVVARQGFEQIAKGVFQLWRFFSHARRKIYGSQPVSPDAVALVLTMDGWMQMAANLRKAAIKRAEEMAAHDPDITEVDKRSVVFASIQELNDTLAQTERPEFLSVLSYAITDKYRGYRLPDIARDCGVRLVRKRYPMDITTLLPWWNRFGKPEDRPGN
ncbi:hypothetical protein MKI84_06335 [Ancylobacter sp. A5.8]|uniref:hypothetical protein n=1 Tax=Ancylobacter gelatini TaxID=2919920 RepID=UPI001F4E0D87|nr:hypothetical protein [Ancylobacter gelatini]MCJ8142530.1 hypothetical protein [Ancylobacter gelatini]